VVLIPDAVNRLQAYYTPESEEAGDTNVLTPAWSYIESGKIPGGGLIARYSSGLVSNGTSVYWVCYATSMLWGLDISGAAPVPIKWSPLDLVAASGNAHFKTWNAESQLLIHDERIWIPAADEHVAMSVFTKDGSHFNPSLALTNHRLMGMVATNPGAVAILSTVDRLSSFDNQANRLWQTDVRFAPVALESSHPVMIDFGSNTRCIIVSKADSGGMRIAGVNPANGKACANWASAGYNLRTQYTWSATWVSAPAVIQEFGRFYLYYSVNLPDEGTNRAGHRSALVQVEVDRYGPIGADQVYAGRLFNGQRLNIAPIAFLNAYGARAHAIAVIKDTGETLILNYKNIGGPVRHTFSAASVLSMPRTATTGYLTTAGK
jgi:hypothetical protein